MYISPDDVSICGKMLIKFGAASCMQNNT